jgi:hypothetical protein
MAKVFMENQQICIEKIDENLHIRILQGLHITRLKGKSNNR